MNCISISQKSVPWYKSWHQCGTRTVIYYQEILENTTPQRQLATEKFPGIEQDTSVTNQNKNNNPIKLLDSIKAE